MARDRGNRGGSDASAPVPAVSDAPSTPPTPSNPGPARREDKEDDREVAKTVGFWSVVGTVLAFVLAGFKSESGRKTAGKAIETGSLTTQLAWKHFTHERGWVATWLGRQHRWLHEFRRNQRAALQWERFWYFVQIIFLPVRFFIPLPGWALIPPRPRDRQRGMRAQHALPAPPPAAVHAQPVLAPAPAMAPVVPINPAAWGATPPPPPGL